MHETCNHTVAYLNDFISESEIVDTLINESYSWSEYNKTMLSLCGGKQYDKQYKPSDFLDRRKGLLTMFNYCPYCGEKINWKEIKASLNLETK